MPATRDRANYVRYIAARKVWRSKIEWQLTLQEATRILNDVKASADSGDWGALALMEHFYLGGLGPLITNKVLEKDPEKAVAIARMAAAAMRPWGLYDLGVAYEHGHGGAHYNVDLAWAYYLKAAQLGSPEAQMALASAYRSAGRMTDEVIMLQCAYLQGHGPAAYKLAIKAEVNRQFQEATLLYQDGVRFGSAHCAQALELTFRDGYFDDNSEAEKMILASIGIGIDAERKIRYGAIADALAINPDLKLSKLDLVLPLPPATLPTWFSVEDAVEPESYERPTY